MKNQSLLADFPILETHLFLHVSDVARRFVLISPTRAMLAMLLRENFLQNRMVDPNAIYGYNTGCTL